ncbi:type VI secretion system contractile sheath large subunit [Pendulispora rubella]|uniref:Type VI secretion system contractile sheath large subunit n=1 Tax=Pendulispora rubella TaxID=2741070 RepID=A0ABZ2KYR2_9BACT
MEFTLRAFFWTKWPSISRKRRGPMTPRPDQSSSLATKRNPAVDRYIERILARVEQLALHDEGIQRWAIDQLIAEIDRHVGAVLDNILHHEDFARLEASWRGLDYAVRHIDFSQNIELCWLNCSKAELSKDFAQVENMASSGLFRIIHSSDYGMFGGRPFSTVFLQFPFDHGKEDVVLLQRVAAVGAAAHVHVYVDAAPRLLGIDTFAAVPHMTAIEDVFNDGAHEEWNRFRDTAEARYLGVLLPRVQLRIPHRRAGKPVRILAVDEHGDLVRDSRGNLLWTQTNPFVYQERIRDHRDLLWGSPAYPLAVLFATHFATFRTSDDLFGTLDVPPPVTDHFPELGPRFPKPPVDVLISHETTVTLARLGLQSVEFARWSSALQFNIGVSLHKPPTFALHEGGELATFEAWLGSMVSYTRIASRYVHYLKVMERERIGANIGRLDIERELNEWIAQYVTSRSRISAVQRRKFPLAYARVQTFDTNQEGVYRIEVKLRPHARVFGQLFELAAAWQSSPAPGRRAA